MLSRAEVIQPFLSMFDEPRYLEVGVCYGDTFFEIDAAEKTAVDVHFNFDVVEAKARQPHAEFFEQSSDEFFGNADFARRKYDVVFLDGLHTFEQTLRDLINTVARLTPRGIVIIDDVLPESYAASLPDMAATHALNGWLKLPLGGWMGDVYKLVFFIETFFQNLSYRTVSENHGQLVAWQSPRAGSDLRLRTAEQVARTPFESVALEVGTYRYAPFADIVDEVKTAMLGLPPVLGGAREPA